MIPNISSDELQPMVGMPVEDFVLHRESMLFIDELIDIDVESATCGWTIAEDFELVVPGYGVPAYAGVEYMAQCIAVHAGAVARAMGLSPPLGYLLGSRHYRTSVAWLETGVIYRSTCQELVRDSQGMGSFACRILRDGECIADANLAVLQTGQ